MKRILFLPNWSVCYLNEDTKEIQSPDKCVQDQPYWFFKYFPDGPQVDVIDIRKRNIIHRLERKIKFYIWQGVLAFFVRKKYDVVISHGAPSGLFYSLLCYLSPFKKNNPKHCIIDIGSLNRGRTNSLEIALIRLTLRSKPYVVYHSSIQKGFYDKYFSKELFGRTKFLRFGVNVDEFEPSGLCPENYVFSFGFEMRDYKTLLEAWNKVHPEGFRLVIVGDAINTEEDPSVVVLPKVNIATLRDFILRSSFVVVPLPVSNFSYGQMSILQSMALGKPVLVSRVPSSIDYIQDGEGAFFVQPEDVDDLCDKLHLFFSRKDDWGVWGKQARTYVERNLSEKRMAQELYDYIKSVKQ